MKIYTEVYPISESKYFTDTTEKTIFEEVYAYFQKYTKPPTKEALLINLDNSTSINENVVKDAKNIVGKFEVDNTPQDWLVDETESWCKDRAIYIAVMDSIEVIDKKSQRSTGEIPVKMHFPCPLILKLDTTSWKTQTIDLISIIQKKRRFLLI